MESKNVGKVVAAFLAGVFLALGGAVFYSRQAETVQSSPSSNAQVGVPAKALTTSNLADLPAAGSLAVVPAKVEDHNTVLSQPVRPVKEPTAAIRKPKPQNLVANPVPAVVTAPAVRRDEETTAQFSPGVLARPAIEAQPASQPNQVVLPAAAPPPLVREPHVVTLPAGTVLNVRVSEALTSERNASGDIFRATLDTPIMADGFIIAERRSPVVGRIIQSNDAGRVRGVASLVLAVSELNTTDGQHVAIATDSYEKWGSSSRKQDTAKIAGGAALGAIIGAIAGGGKGAAIGAGAGGAAGTGVVLGTKGGPAAVASETVLTFRLASPVTLTEKFN